MFFYCLKCRKNSGTKKEIIKTKNGIIMLLSKREVCDSKQSQFIKEQETRGLLVA